MLARDRIWRRRDRRKQPVWVRDVIKEAIVLKPSIGAFETIPLRVLDTDAHIAVGIGPPTSRGDQHGVEQIALAVFRLHEKARVEQSRAGLIVQVALKLIYV